MQQQQQMIDLIKSECERLGVPPQVALAFASIESGFKPAAEGDMLWHERNGGAKYRALVLENPHFEQNPWRAFPELWHSYGLFQLLAPYACGPLEDPRSLLDPVRNTRAGVAKIAGLLRTTHGDPYAARLAYVGCGADGSRCSTETVQAIRGRLADELLKWEGVT